MGLFKKRKPREASPEPPPVPVDTRPLPQPLPFHAQQTATGFAGPGISQSAFGSPTHSLSSQPQGWGSGHSPCSYQQRPELSQPPPIVVNQLYYLLPGPPVTAPQTQMSPPNYGALQRLDLESAANMAGQVVPGIHLFTNDIAALQRYSAASVSQGNAIADQICDRFNSVMTSIDCDRYAGDEKDLFTYQTPLAEFDNTPYETAETKTKGTALTSRKGSGKDPSKGQTAAAVTNCVASGGYFAKVELYANSRLPLGLPPLKLYIPTYPLLCLAAQYSERVYEKPRGAERDVHVEANFHTGTKAMVVKSVPMDHMNTIVFAIRGTSTFMDWAVNLNTAPTPPTGFLDDVGNLCHAGFLSVAKKMMKPVASRLRQLLQEDPSRSSYSLLITGHSAGGAVASLLYSHMLSASKAAESELSVLRACFKRIHCITFGTPPVSLLPLQKPNIPNRPDLKKSLFLGFVNEGDPVARADKAYVRSLLELFATPAPAPVKGPTKSSSTLRLGLPECKAPKEKHSKASLASARSGKSGKSSSPSSKSKATAVSGPTWKVPSCALSNAGRIVVLRSGDPKARLKGRKTVEERLNEGVVAQIATDEQLRGVIWGDPVSHMMKLYAGRLEILAVGAVTAQGY